MLKRIEDITVISADEFLSYEGDLIFVDTQAPFRSQPIAQAYLALGDSEDTLPSLWQEISLYGSDIFITFEEGVIHTFISLDFKEQLESGQYIFIKVIAIGEPDEKKPIRIV